MNYFSNLLNQATTPNPKVPRLLNSMSPYVPQNKQPIPTNQQTTQTTKPAPVTPTKDYSKFTDSDWKTYYANKGQAPKPLVSIPSQKQTTLNTKPQQQPTTTVNPNANYFNQPSQTSNISSGSIQNNQMPQYQPQATFPGLVQDIATISKDRTAIDKANQDLLNLRKDYAQKVGNIETTPIPLEFQQGRAQVLNRQYASQEGALQQALANEIAQKGQTISGLATAGGFATPRSADILVSPLTGEVIGNQNNLASGLANWASIRQGANTAGQFTADYQTGLANLRASDTIKQQIINTLQQNPTLNSQPLSAITNLKELISGQISSGPQQLLSQQVAQYIQTLGLDPNTVMNIASQQQGTLGQLLDSLREMAGAQIEAKNPQNIINNPQGINQPQSKGSSQIINTAVGPIDNSWF